MAASIPASLTVDTANREEVRLFYRAIYPASENATMNWTGNYASGDVTTAAGDTAPAFKDAVNLRVNFFRALAGVPGSVTFNPAYGAKAQKAALMMSANNALSHSPPSNWLYYSADGAEAAGNSDLALGVAGPSAIDGYIADPGSNNAAVGHRRWVLYPQTQQMGTGDVAGNGALLPANALWVFDANINGARPYVRDSFVAWPAAGYVPYQVVFPRWSISYPNANFSSATVTMTRDGVAVPVTLAAITNGYGENTLVWTYDNLDATSGTPHARPAADTTYNVAVSNVVINGQAQSFNYSVIVFDPDVAGVDADPVAITGPATPDMGTASSYSVGGLYYATGFQWRVLSTAAYSAIEGAENGTSGFTLSTTGSYGVTQTSVKAAGSSAFHLAHPTTATQHVTLTQAFLATESAQLTFQSRLGYAMTSQVAHVQVSLDEGASWMDVYSQAGSGGAGESGFTQRTVSLASLSGRTFQVRFVYTFSGGSYYPGTSTGIGWYFDDIALTGVSSVSAGDGSATQSGNQFFYTPAAAGTFGLQARGVFHGQYPLDWGPVKTITVAQAQPQAPAITTQPSSQAVAPGANVAFSVTATGVPAPTYQWRKNGIAITGATSATLTLLNVQAADAASYSVTVANSSGTVTSSDATLAISAASIAPVITTNPSGVNALIGTSVSLSVVASGNPSPGYQWMKDGLTLAGATASTLNLSNVQASDAATYTVAVGNAVGTTVSPGALVTVSAPLSITTSPTSQTVTGGATATLSVAASGTNLSYQWYAGASGDTSTPISGAAGASYTTPVLSTTTQFWVRVATPAQSANSQTATVTVTGSARYFFGTFGSAQTGTFGLLVRANNSAVFLAALPVLGTWIDASAISVSGGGAFSFTGPGSLGTVSGQITGGNVTGSVSGASLSFSGTQDGAAGATAAFAGNYGTVIVNSADGDVRILAGPAGRAFVLTGLAGTYSGATVTLGADGAINASLPDGRTLALTLAASSGLASGSTAAGGASAPVSGVREGVITSQRLANISVRAQVRQGEQIMIAGFVVSGSGTKNVLIRGIGPTLAAFGVTGVLADPTIAVHRQGDPVGSPPIASNDNWGSAANAAQIATVAAALQAFPLDAASQDAVLLLNLPAGAYTAQISGVSGATGAALAEVYDADEAAGVASTANLINISMRGDAGGGEKVVIAGFVVTGAVPKRVLIRGVGSELAGFGVGDVLANPTLDVFRRADGNDTKILSNDDWASGGQQAVVAAVSTQVNAFALTPGSQSSAIVAWLEPGIYTAVASSADSTSGTALVEVYEVP